MAQIYNRAQFAHALAAQAQLTPGQAEAALRGLGTLVVSRVKRGDCIMLDGFGLFERIEHNGKPVLVFRQHKRVKEEMTQ